MRESKSVPMKAAVRVAFYYGILELVGVFPEDLKWEEELREMARGALNGERIATNNRLVHDRFAAVCSNLHIFGDDYFELRQAHLQSDFLLPFNKEGE